LQNTEHQPGAGSIPDYSFVFALKIDQRVKIVLTAELQITSIMINKKVRINTLFG